MKASLLLVMMVTVGCARSPLRPIAVDTAHDTCENCRMVVSDVRVAAQIVAPGEEPRLFDDIGCLREYLGSHALSNDAVVFVAEHRTGEWIDAGRATYTRTRQALTPMGSRLIAHASLASRDADPAAVGGEPVADASSAAVRRQAESTR